MLRHALFPPEAAVYGVSYAFLQNIIRSPEPLDPEWTWHVVTRDMPRGTNWIRMKWPLRPLRRVLLGAKMRQDHVLGISAHYDVSNEFYELFLDKRYMFYSCADFHHAERDDRRGPAAQGRSHPQPDRPEARAKDSRARLRLGVDAQAHRRGHRRQATTCTASRCRASKRLTTASTTASTSISTTSSPATTPRRSSTRFTRSAPGSTCAQREIAPLLAKLYRALKPGGRLVQHFITRMNDELVATVACSQIFFPGSLGASYRFHNSAHDRAGFRTTHRSLHDYRPTLRAWFDNLVAHQGRGAEARASAASTTVISRSSPRRGDTFTTIRAS